MYNSYMKDDNPDVGVTNFITDKSEVEVKEAVGLINKVIPPPTTN